MCFEQEIKTKKNKIKSEGYLEYFSVQEEMNNEWKFKGQKIKTILEVISRDQMNRIEGPI